jgi:hypothetical protein
VDVLWIELEYRREFRADEFLATPRPAYLQEPGLLQDPVDRTGEAFAPTDWTQALVHVIDNRLNRICTAVQALRQDSDRCSR